MDQEDEGNSEGNRVMEHRIFGTKEEGTYYDRQGAYVLLVRGDAIGIVRTPKGLFLVGGGIDEGEDDIRCIQRESVEEIGYSVRIQEKVCSAETYCVHNKVGLFHPIQAYYLAELGEKVCEPIEKDHELLWVTYEEIRGKMFSEMQNWALDECVKVYHP